MPFGPKHFFRTCGIDASYHCLRHRGGLQLGVCVMMRFGPASVGVDRGAEILFSACDDGGEMWTGSGPRIVRKRLTFSEPFVDAPVVHVALGMWDTDRDSNQRLDVYADRITAASFEIVFRTWGDSRVARVRAEWFAIGPVAHEGDFDV